MEDYELVDMEHWNRKLHYMIFSQYQKPTYDISCELDITNFYKRIHEEKLSFTLSMIYAVSTCANQIEEFQYRLVDGKVVQYNKIKLSFTYLNQETELLKNIVADPKDSIQEFVTSAKKTADDQKVYFTGPLDAGIYQFSSIPWITYTHISHTDSGKKDCGVPMFDWGRYYEKEGKLMLPFSIQANHAFVDGIHMGKLVQLLQNYLNTY